MKPIFGETRSETWLKAVRHLRECDGFEDYNVVLEVKAPNLSTDEDRAIDGRVNALLRGANVLPINSVAETIFPGTEYRHHGPNGVYNIYPDEVFPRIRPVLGWGTYAYRLLRAPGRDGKDIRPLEKCVQKMKDQLSKEKGGIKTACYELSLAGEDEAFELPTYRAANDQGHTYGRPCLSHVSLKITRDRRLNLTALYRSHYYVERALGNLLGLARLQAFVAKETGLGIGTLVCVSTYARLDFRTGWGITKIDELLETLPGPVAA
jgi:hypothetical protein